MPRQINFIAVTMTASASRGRTLPMRRFLEVCALCVFMLTGAGTLAAHPADPAPAPAASPTAGPAADRAPLQSSLQSGIAAAEAGRLSEAITILTENAERNNATANYTLGLVYTCAGQAMPRLRPAVPQAFQERRTTRSYRGGVRGGLPV